MSACTILSTEQSSKPHKTGKVGERHQEFMGKVEECDEYSSIQSTPSPFNVP